MAYLTNKSPESEQIKPAPNARNTDNAYLTQSPPFMPIGDTWSQTLLTETSHLT